MAEYVPISFEEWKRGNPDLCQPCQNCDGEGGIECDLGHFHDCEECAGSGSTGPEVYRAHVRADREKWDAAMALRRTG